MTIYRFNEVGRARDNSNPRSVRHSKERKSTEMEGKKNNLIYGLIHWSPDGWEYEEYFQTYDEAMKAQNEYECDENFWTSIEEVYEDEEGNEVRTDVI